MAEQKELEVRTNSSNGSQITFHSSSSEAPAALRYKRGRLDFAEHRENYRPGGLHPVHLGDILPENGQYQVVQKLGEGGFGTVWLCRNVHSKEFVALKILMAKYSRDNCADLKLTQWLGRSELDPSITPPHLATPIDTFWIEGPNGRHACLILPVLGSRISDIWTDVPQPEKLLPKLLYGAIQGLQELHSSGICHGDFRPANLLVRLSNIDHLNDEAVEELLGEPDKDPVFLADGGHPGPHGPEYLVCSAYMQDISLEYATGDVCLVDFGESFTGHKSSKDLGIPLPWRSPELILGKTADKAVDIWALACTMVEVLTDLKLFDDFLADNNDMILEWIKILGPLPDDLWESWQARNKFFDEDRNPLQKSDEEDNRSLRKLLDRYESRFIGASSIKKTLAIPENDRGPLADLLSKMLKYDPKERIGLDEILQHEYWMNKVGNIKPGAQDRRQDSSNAVLDHDAEADTLDLLNDEGGKDARENISCGENVHVWSFRKEIV